jgi:hypothetical protein
VQCDIVVAPVSPTSKEGLLVVPKDVDVAYVLPWQHHLDVRWKPSGILVVRGELARTATHNFGGQVLGCRTVRATGMVGHPTAIPDIALDLLRAGASRVTIGGANFYISHEVMYRSDEVRVGLDSWNSNGSPFFMTSMFSTHPPIENRNFVRTLALSGRIEFLGELRSVMNMSDDHAAQLLEDSWTRPRR